MARVTAVCVSKHRGTRKLPSTGAMLLVGHGLKGDAHAGSPGRQISLLSEMSLAEMECANIDTAHGCCGENIDVSAEMELHSLLPGVRLSIGTSAVVETTAVGKDNSDGHADMVIEGNLFPEQGLFADVVVDGEVFPGDEIKLIREPGFSAGILTVSDTTSQGLREDLSGPAVIDLVRMNGLLPARYSVVSDDLSEIASLLRHWCGDGSLDVLFTVGGTGFSPRDNTPEATNMVCSRMVPGIPEMVRSRSAETVRSAWLSRAVSGICGSTLIINLPGSRKAALECAGFCIEVLEHGLSVLSGEVGMCGG